MILFLGVPKLFFASLSLLCSTYFAADGDIVTLNSINKPSWCQGDEENSTPRPQHVSPAECKHSFAHFSSLNLFFHPSIKSEAALPRLVLLSVIWAAIVELHRSDKQAAAAAEDGIVLCKHSPEPSCETLVCTELLCAESKYHLQPHTALRNKPWGKSSL